VRRKSSGAEGKERKEPVPSARQRGKRFKKKCGVGLEAPKREARVGQNPKKGAVSKNGKIEQANGRPCPKKKAKKVSRGHKRKDGSGIGKSSCQSGGAELGKRIVGPRAPRGGNAGRG